jgi:hypothetical protein
MKGIIIGSDLLETNDSVQFLEINTNTTIYNSGADMLDYDSLFAMLVDNNITEFHFIWTESSSYTPLTESYRFKEILEEKCTENLITFTEYMVPLGSITVPYIEDTPYKFILRQAYDTTALVDESYCGDKFGFFSLMSGSLYTPKTSYTSTDMTLNTLDVVDFTTTTNPNVLVKSRYPQYDAATYPSLYRVSDTTELQTLINELPSNYLAQEFVFSEDNLVDGRYSVIRSIDVLYGSNLDVINLGGYKQSTIIPMSFTPDEFVTDTNKLNQKSRYKYITKEIGNFAKVDYHTDDDTMILNFNGTLADVDTVQIGELIRSIDYVDFNDNHAAKFEEGKINVFGWDSTLVRDNETLTQTGSVLNNITSASVDTIYVRITLEDGRTWTDAPSCMYYIEESGSLSTKFEKVNQLYIGDKLVITDSNTNELTKVEVVGLEMEHAQKTIYNLDFEPSDLFLVDFGDGDFGIMHNSCYCPWIYCGYYCNSSYCPSCGGGGGGFEKIQ